MALGFHDEGASAQSLVECADVFRTGDVVVETACDEDVVRRVDGLGVGGADEGLIASDEFFSDAAETELPPQAASGSGPPQRVAQIDDGFQQGDPAKVAFDGREQGADPGAVAAGPESEFRATLRTQPCHQLAQFHHAAAQSFRCADEIGGDGEFAIKMPARRA